MAVSTSALTLADYAVQSNDPIVAKITDSLLRNGSVLADLPLVTRTSLLVNGVRWQGNLPTVNWGRINEDPTVTKGNPTPYQEQAYLVRNAIDVDKWLIRDENAIQDPRAVQIGGYLAALTYDINDKFINNDHVTGDVDAPTGLRYRLDNPSTYGVTSEMKIDGGGVDMTQGNMTAATANNFFELVGQTLDYMGAPEGDGCVIYMNDTLRRRFERAVRLVGAGAGWSMVEDAFGRRIMKYRNATVADIGRKADQSTRIITNTETSAGAAGSSTYSSFYVVRYGEEYSMGWQLDELGNCLEDIGRIGNAGSTFRFLIDWGFGLYFQHTRGIARVYGVKMS